MWWLKNKKRVSSAPIYLTDCGRITIFCKDIKIPLRIIAKSTRTVHAVRSKYT